MKDLLDLLMREGGEELRLLADHPPMIVVRGKPLTIGLPAVSSDNVSELLQNIAGEAQMGELSACGDLHFIYVAHHSSRFSVAATMQRHALNVKIKNLGR